MTENKEIIKAGGVFITHRTREAIYATAAQRTEPELKNVLRCYMTAWIGSVNKLR